MNCLSLLSEPGKKVVARGRIDFILPSGEFPCSKTIRFVWLRILSFEQNLRKQARHHMLGFKTMTLHKGQPVG
jgi:hypothetical protein